MNKAAATAMGLKSLLADLAVDLEIKVFTDATTGKAMATRRGLGKVRHIAVNELWLQEKMHDGNIKVMNIKNTFNPADLMTKHLSKSIDRSHTRTTCPRPCRRQKRARTRVGDSYSEGTPWRCRTCSKVLAKSMSGIVQIGLTSKLAIRRIQV